MIFTLFFSLLSLAGEAKFVPQAELLQVQCAYQSIDASSGYWYGQVAFAYTEQEYRRVDVAHFRSIESAYTGRTIVSQWCSSLKAALLDHQRVGLFVEFGYLNRLDGIQF